MNKITKLLLATSLAALPSMAGVFIGLDYNGGDDLSAESTTSSGHQLKTNEEVLSGYTISLGAGSVDSGIFEVYYSSQSVSDGHVFVVADDSAKYIYSGDEYSEIGINYRPYWEIAKDFHWYLDLGAAYGSTEVSALPGIVLSDSSVSTVALKAGAGVSYTLLNQFELNLGYRHSFNTWSDIEITDGFSFYDTVSTTSSGGGIYLGVNIWLGDSSSEVASNDSNSEEIQENSSIATPPEKTSYETPTYETPSSELTESSDEVF